MPPSWQAVCCWAPHPVLSFTSDFSNTTTATGRRSCRTHENCMHAEQIIIIFHIDFFFCSIYLVLFSIVLYRIVTVYTDNIFLWQMHSPVGCFTPARGKNVQKNRNVSRVNQFVTITIYQDILTTLRIVKRNKIHKPSSWEICLILDYSVKLLFSVKPTNRSDVTVYFVYPWFQPTCIGKVWRCVSSRSSLKNACRMPWTAKNPSFSTSLHCQFEDLHCCMCPIQLHGITLSRLLYCMKKTFTFSFILN